MDTDGASGASQPDIPGMAALLAQQEADALRQTRRSTVGIPVCWGVVWALGLLALWGGGLALLPPGLQWWLVGGLVLTGMVVSTVLGLAEGRGRRGPSSIAGQQIGGTFAIGLAAAVGIDAGLVRTGLTAPQISLLLAVTFACLIGVVHLVAAILVGSRTLAITGVGLLLVAGVASLVGPPHHCAIVALGGLIMIVGALSGRGR